MYKLIIAAIVVVLTTLAAVSADLYVSSSGPGFWGNTGTISYSGRGGYGGALITPDGMYASANTRHGSASFGSYNGDITGISVRTSNVRGYSYRMSDGTYAGSWGVGNRIHTPTYYHTGTYYGGGAYGGNTPRMSGTTVRNTGYVTSAEYIRSRYY